MSYRFFAFLVVFLPLSLTSCSTLQGVHARLTYDFKIDPKDDRIFYENGTEAAASVISENLDVSLKQTEIAHFSSFKDSSRIKIYLFNDQKRYMQFMYKTNALGGSTTHEAMISLPRIRQRLSSELCQLQKCPDTAEDILLHELSHIHMRQYLGTWNYVTKVPKWFHEGLATLVSNGAGAGLVSKADLRNLILSGTHLIPYDSGSLISRPDTIGNSRFGSISFYRQSEMFVEFLKNKNPMGFQKALNEIREGHLFRAVWVHNYGKNIADLWDIFTDNLQNFNY